MNDIPEIGPARAEQLLAAELATDPGPVPVMAGTFALYRTPDNGFVLVTDVDGELTRKHIPGAVVRLVTGDGILGKQVRRAMGG